MSVNYCKIHPHAAMVACFDCHKALDARVSALREGLRKALDVLSMPSAEKLTHAKRIIDYDPAGSTYEMVPHPWFQELQKLLED